MGLNHRVKFTSIPENSGSVFIVPEHVEAVVVTPDATFIEMVSGKTHKVKEDVFKIINRLQEG